MKFKKTTVFALLLCAILLLSSCGHTHSFGKWEDHGSYQSRECKECGYIEKEYFDGSKGGKETSNIPDFESDIGSIDVSNNDSSKNETVVCTRIDYIPTFSAGDSFLKYALFEYNDEGILLYKIAYDRLGREKPECFNTYHLAFEDSSSGNYKNITQSTENGLMVEYRDKWMSNDGSKYERWKVIYNEDGTPRTEKIIYICDQSLANYLAYGVHQFDYTYNKDGTVATIVGYYDKYNHNTSYEFEDGDDRYQYATVVFTYKTLSQYLAEKGTNSLTDFSGGNGNYGGNSAGGVTPKTCPACLGNKGKECSGCDGQKKVLSYYDVNHNPVYITCPICHGSGFVTCKVCGGDGMVYD